MVIERRDPERRREVNVECIPRNPRALDREESAGQHLLGVGDSVELHCARAGGQPAGHAQLDRKLGGGRRGASMHQMAYNEPGGAVGVGILVCRLLKREQRAVSRMLIPKAHAHFARRVQVDIERLGRGGDEVDGVAQLGEGLGERAPTAREPVVALSPGLVRCAAERQHVNVRGRCGRGGARGPLPAAARLVAARRGATRCHE